MHTIKNHTEKVDFIYSFLKGGIENEAFYLIIIGEGGSGKTTALNEALNMSNEIHNIHIWNQGEKPYIIISENSLANQWIFIRREVDNFTKCLQNEFICATVKFEKEKEI